MEKQAYFKNLPDRKNPNIRTFLTPQGLFRAIKSPEDDWVLFKVHANYDKFLARVKCSTCARNKTIYQHYIVS